MQEMQSNCDKGLKHMSCEAPLLGPMAELWLVHHDILTKNWFAFPCFIHSTQCLSKCLIEICQQEAEEPRYF